MIGLASAGCSRAVRRRPNAALVAESKRSGSSSSRGAVASGMSSVAGAVVWRCFWVVGEQSDISVGIHRGFGWRVGGYRGWGPNEASTGTRICCLGKPVVDHPIVVEWKGAVEVSGFQWDSGSTDNVICNVNPKPLWSGTGSGGDGDEDCYRESPLIQRWGEDFSGHCVFPRGLEFDGNVAGVGSPGRVYPRSNAFAEDALEGGGVAIIDTKWGKGSEWDGIDKILDPMRRQPHPIACRLTFRCWLGKRISPSMTLVTPKCDSVPWANY